MKFYVRLSFICLMAISAFVTSAASQGVTRPVVLMDKVVSGMPRGAEQQVRVMAASFKPGDRTLFHTHRFPVTVYIIDGEFTLDLADRKEPVVLKAGQSFIEPVGVKMTGYNRSTNAPLNLIIFYVSDKDTPFLDPIDADKHASH